MNAIFADHASNPISIENVNVWDGDVGIVLSGTVEGGLLHDVLIKNTNVGLVIGTDIQATISYNNNLFVDNTTNLIDPNNTLTCQNAIEQSGQIEVLKSSDWLHSTQTSGTKPFEDLMTEVLAMGVGKINEVSSGVFDFYGQDDTTVIYTLTKSGSQRIRS